MRYARRQIQHMQKHGYCAVRAWHASRALSRGAYPHHAGQSLRAHGVEKTYAATPSTPTRNWHGRHQANLTCRATTSSPFGPEWQLGEGAAGLLHPEYAMRGASALATKQARLGKE